MKTRILLITLLVLIVAVRTAGAVSITSRSDITLDQGACNVAVNDSTTSATALLHILIVDATHFYKKQNNSQAGHHFVTDDCEECNLLTVDDADLYGASNPKSIHISARHTYLFCESPFGIFEETGMSAANAPCP